MSLDIEPALRTAVLADFDIASMLGGYEGEASVHTRRPVPDGAEYPMIVIAAMPVTDADLINTSLPVVSADIVAYGQQPADYRAISEIGYNLRELFHRNRWAITPTGYRVVEILALGPLPAPTDDETTVARVVTLTIRLQKQEI